MPGKLCQGAHRNNAGAGRLSGSKAFCEGMSYRASGTLIQKPVTDNPHPDSSEDGLAWGNGWNVANDSAGGNVSKALIGCCAASGVVPV